MRFRMKNIEIIEFLHLLLLHSCEHHSFDGVTISISIKAEKIKEFENFINSNEFEFCTILPNNKGEIQINRSVNQNLTIFYNEKDFYNRFSEQNRIDHNIGIILFEDKFVYYNSSEGFTDDSIMIENFITIVYFFKKSLLMLILFLFTTRKSMYL